MGSLGHSNIRSSAALVFWGETRNEVDPIGSFSCRFLVRPLQGELIISSMGWNSLDMAELREPPWGFAAARSNCASTHATRNIPASFRFPLS